MLLTKTGEDMKIRHGERYALEGAGALQLHPTWAA